MAIERIMLINERCDLREMALRTAEGEAGCDDALVGTGQPGHIALEFRREAFSAEQALVSALSDVKKAIPCARLLEVTPAVVRMT
jgi:hypothetical protein